jgi:hypothetical protein
MDRIGRALPVRGVVIFPRTIGHLTFSRAIGPVLSAAGRWAAPDQAPSTPAIGRPMGVIIINHNLGCCYYHLLAVRDELVHSFLAYPPGRCRR